MLTFTKTEQKIIDLLSDGKGHRPTEICEHLGEGECEVVKSAMMVRVSELNKKLATIGEKIACMSRGKWVYYQHVRLIKSDD